MKYLSQVICVVLLSLSIVWGSCVQSPASTSAPGGASSTSTPSAQPTTPASVSAVPPDAPVVQVVVRSDTTGFVIPPDFIGLGYDMPLLAGKYFSKDNQQLVNLIKNLGNGVLYYGANGVEYTFWPRSLISRFQFWNARAVLAPEDIDRMFGFAKELGWRVIFALNLRANNPDMAADLAAYVAKAGGSSLLAFEIGNEPDLYSRNKIRSTGYSYMDYNNEFSVHWQKIRARVPNVPIAGPNAASNFQWFSSFLQDWSTIITLATNHHYPLNANDSVRVDDPTYASIENLLSAATTKRTIDLTRNYANAARKAGVPMRFEETNSSYPLKNGVGDTFAAALWGADYLYTLAELGIAGTNFFGSMECHGYTPICLEKDFLGRNADYNVQPLYYGMLFFQMAAKGRTVPVDMNTPINVTAHATLGDDGQTRVAIINKDPRQTIVARIQSANSYMNASAIRLTANSLDATKGVTLAGSAVREDGTWSPQVEEQVLREGTFFQVVVPAASAVAVTLRNN